MRSACGSHLADFTLALSMKSKSPVINIIHSKDKCDIRPMSSFTGKNLSFCDMEFKQGSWITTFIPLLNNTVVEILKTV